MWLTNLNSQTKCWQCAASFDEKLVQYQPRGNIVCDFQNVCEATIIYRETSNTSRTLVGNKIVDHSDVVGALPVGAAPTTSSFSF